MIDIELNPRILWCQGHVLPTSLSWEHKEAQCRFLLSGVWFNVGQRDDPENVSHSLYRDQSSPIHSLLGLSWPQHLGAQILGRDIHNRSYSIMFNATPFDNHNSLRLSKVKGFAQGVQLLKSKARLFIVSHHPLVPWVRWPMPQAAEKPQTRDRGVYQGQEVQRLASSVNQGSHRPGRCALTIRLGFCLQSNGRDWVPKKVADGQCNQFHIHHSRGVWFGFIFYCGKI